MDVHVIEASWREKGAELGAVRKQVFVVEQNVPEEEEWDGMDEDAAHFLALSAAGQAVGCARLLPSGQIGRMAVLTEWRGTGLGARLLDAAIEHAKARGDDRVFLHAQEHALDFYKKGGFVVTGGRFYEAGIPHFAMELKLPLAFDISPPKARPAVRPQVSDLPEETVDPQPFDNLDEAAAGLVEIIDSATREIAILSPYLDQALFERGEVVEALSRFARSNPRASVRILIMSSKLIVDRGHRVLDLTRRLDTKLTMKLLDEEISEDTSSMVVADRMGYWLQPSHELPRGVCDLKNPVNAERMRNAFDQAWERSRSDPELRVLRL